MPTQRSPGIENMPRWVRGWPLIPRVWPILILLTLVVGLRKPIVGVVVVGVISLFGLWLLGSGGAAIRPYAVNPPPVLVWRWAGAAFLAVGVALPVWLVALQGPRLGPLHVIGTILVLVPLAAGYVLRRYRGFSFWRLQ